MSSPPSRIAIELTDEHFAFPNFILRVTQDLATRVENISSPKDIDNIISSELNFIKLIHHKITTASGVQRAIYRALGVKPEEIAILNEDVKIAESWINWYKAKRIEDTAAIRQVESFLPAFPEFRIYHCKFSFRRLSLKIQPNEYVEGISYRIFQSFEYAKILYNIFCAPIAAPAPGQPLPEDLPTPYFRDIPSTRTSLGAQLFRGKPYAKFEAEIAKHFLLSSIIKGTTSELLPFFPVERLHWLPEDHPIRLESME